MSEEALSNLDLEAPGLLDRTLIADGQRPLVTLGEVRLETNEYGTSLVIPFTTEEPSKRHGDEEKIEAGFSGTLYKRLPAANASDKQKRAVARLLASLQVACGAERPSNSFDWSSLSGRQVRPTFDVYEPVAKDGQPPKEPRQDVTWFNPAK